jgi:hypothetical protein
MNKNKKRCKNRIFFEPSNLTMIIFTVWLKGTGLLFAASGKSIR